MNKRVVVFCKGSRHIRRKRYKVIGGESYFYKREIDTRRIKIRIWDDIAIDSEYSLRRRFKNKAYDAIVNTLFNWTFKTNINDEIDNLRGKQDEA